MSKVSTMKRRCTSLKCWKPCRRVFGDEYSSHIESTIKLLIQLYDDWGKPEEAEKYRDMLPEEKTDDPE